MVKWTKEYTKEYMHNYYTNHKIEWDEYTNKWKSDNIEKVKSIKHNSFTKNREKIYARRRQLMKQKRLKLIEILGGSKCIKCGYCDDWRALTLDHIRDDGKEDRRNHTSSYMLYTYYIRNPNIARSNLQVLCCNCNNIKKYDNMGFTGLDD